MIHLMRKYLKASLVSFVVLAISLPVFAMAVVAPVVKALPTNHEGGARPNAVAIAADGSLYVGNFAGGVINQLDPAGKFIRKVNKLPIYSYDISFAADGTLLVVANSSVVRMALDGTVIGTLLSPAMSGPRSVAVDDLGYIYVVDNTKGQVHVFGADYQYRSTFGSEGSALGQLKSPTRIVFDKVNRRLLVADTLNSRIQVFDLNGNPIAAFGGPAAVMGRPILPLEFHSPQGVAIEYTKVAPYQLNRLYILDSFQNMVQVIDPLTYAPLLFPGTTNNFIVGSATLSDTSIAAPTDIDYDQVNGRLLIAQDYGISIFGIDGGGNPADTTPPALWVLAPYATIEVPRLPITGTVEPGSTVTVSFPGVVEPIEYFGTMNWRTAVSPLVPGTNTFTVTAKDAAGNVTAPQTFSIDYVLPAPPVAVNAVPAVTNAASLVIRGTVGAGAAVKVKNSATQVEGDAVVNGAEWTYTAALVEGLNALQISAKAANSKTAVIDAAVILDTASPVLQVSALSNGSVTSQSVQNIAGTVSDAGQVAVLVNNVPVDVINGSYSTAVTLEEGANQIVVIASDAAGNAVQDVRTITFDSTKPVITLADSTLPDNATTQNALYAITGQVSEAAAVKVAGVDVVVDAANNWTSMINLVPGTNTIEVVATDVAGNSSSVKRTVTYSVASVELAIVHPSQDVAKTKKDEIRFIGSVASTSIASVSYSVNGAKGVAVPLRNGRFNFEVDFDKPGTYSVAITAKDSFGAESTAVRTIIFDKHNNKHKKR